MENKIQHGHINCNSSLYSVAIFNKSTKRTSIEDQRVSIVSIIMDSVVIICYYNSMITEDGKPQDKLPELPKTGYTKLDNKKKTTREEELVKEPLL